ncbi:hypothetical protein LPJ77_003177, partial [Coemansia sp. RSA 2523]
MCIVTTYVDDLLIATADTGELAATKRALSDRFEMKDLGKCTSILSIDIEQKDGAIRVFQESAV